jgi:hypothetical protein
VKSIEEDKVIVDIINFGFLQSWLGYKLGKKTTTTTTRDHLIFFRI